MDRRFLLAFFTVSLLFLMLNSPVDGSAVKTEFMRSRTLLQRPESEKTIADPPASAVEADNDEREGAAEAPGRRTIGRHHSSDKSVAGGGVIIGGLVTAIFAAVYCYIRVTRRSAAATLT